MIEFIVYGIPGPQGSKSFKGLSKKTGKGIMVESSAKVKPWRDAVKMAAVNEAAALSLKALSRGENDPLPLDGPLIARMVFTLPKPKSAPKRRVTYADKKPDLSKLARSTEDALTDARLIADDARIVGYSRLWKTYPSEDPEALDRPGVRIRIEALRAVGVPDEG